MQAFARDKNISSTVIALVVAALIALCPIGGQAAEKLEAHWGVDGEDADLQFEFQDGRYVARVLDNVESCGLSVCEVVFQGTLDPSGILTGEVRSCADKHCIRPNWRFTMGRLSQNSDKLSFFGAGVHVENCQERGEGDPGATSLTRKSSLRVDCDARRAIEDVQRRIRPKMVLDEVQPLLDEVTALMDRFPAEMGRLLLLRGRIYSVLGTPRRTEQARADFERSAQEHQEGWAHCELAMLAANGSEKSIQRAGELLVKCHQAEILTCRQLKSPRMDSLRSQKEFWDLWKNLDCGSRP